MQRSRNFKPSLCCGVILLFITLLSLFGGIAQIDPFVFEFDISYRERILTIMTVLIVGVIFAVILISLSIWIYLKDSREMNPKILPERELLESTPVEQPKEIEFLQEQVKITTFEAQPEETPEKVELLQEEVEITALEEQSEILIPPEPQIIKCPLCGIDIVGEPTF
jgi:hypothetical protein